MADVEEYTYEVGGEWEGRRLDRFLADQSEPNESRSQVKKRIDAGEVHLNGERVSKGGHFLEPGDAVRWCYEPPTEPDLEPQALDVPILYEDERLAVVDKPAGMVVHPGPGHPDGTLVNALLYHLDNLSGVGGELRPGIVHRLDKNTSGALVVSKDDETHRTLAEQFKAHSIDREYRAIVHGPGLSDEGTFDTPHGRDPDNRIRYTGRVDAKRRAVTHYEVVERFESGACLVACRLETGRTHQIRMHFYEANAPVLGDDTYGGSSTSNTRIIDRQALHARSLGFEHPDGSRRHVEAAYPADFERALETLERGGDWRR